MQYALKVFEYENSRKFRTVNRDGEPWFFLVDVCAELEIGNPSQAASRLDDDEKATLINSEGRAGSGPQAFAIINESGLYSLILTSRKPAAKKFKKWVTAEVLPAIRRTGRYGGSRTPAFIGRYNANWDRVDVGYFSIISELTIRLWGRLEQVGHVMADRAPDGKELRPDVSVGRLFSIWLQEKHANVSDDYTWYLHWTPQGEFPARQYPIRLLPLYIQFVDEDWVPNHSESYFRTRDAAALPHLPKLLPGPDKPKPGMTRRISNARRKKAA